MERIKQRKRGQNSFFSLFFVVFELKAGIIRQYCLLKNEPIVKNGIKISHNHQGTRLPTGSKRVASILAYRGVFRNRIVNFVSIFIIFPLLL